MEEIEKIEEIVPFGLRMRSSLKKELDAVVAEKKKTKTKRWSLNSEIVERLEKSGVSPRELKDYKDGELIQELLNRYGRDGIFIRIGKDG